MFTIKRKDFTIGFNVLEEVKTMNLNKALVPLLETGTLEEIKTLVECNLRLEFVVAELERTKRFDSLPVLLPLLNLDKNEKLRERFNRMYTEALVEDDKKSVEALEKHVGLYLNNNAIAFHCGALTKTNILPDCLRQDYLFYMGYLEGLVSADNLEFYLEAVQWHNVSERDKQELYAKAGEYCALKMMNYFGYSQSALEAYIEGAIFEKNKETFLYLLTQTEYKKCVERFYKKLLTQDGYFQEEKVVLTTYLLQEGLITISQEEWSKIKKKNSDFYAEMQADV